VLLDELNSDVPGQVRVKVTRPGLDKFQRGVVLIPQHSILLGTQDGQPVYGQSRLPVTLDQIERPDGTLVRLTKAKLADQAGAQGVTGKVNHHLGRVILGAELSALLSIGTRAPFGNTTNFQPTLPQEFAQDVGSSLNRSGQQIVQRELTVPPTIIVPAGTPVSLSLGDNVSFSQPPTLTR
jgi:type IV secretion system protein VirB10